MSSFSGLSDDSTDGVVVFRNEEITKRSSADDGRSFMVRKTLMVVINNSSV